MTGERLPLSGPPGGQVSGELRMVLREPGARGERLLPHGAPQPLREPDARLAGPAAVGLMGLMIGAGYTQAVVLGEPAMVTSPVIIFVLAAVAAWLPSRNR